jgi:ABC-2 type transport system permease protein/lipopolysaccharide transport system permease protein
MQALSTTTTDRAASDIGIFQLSFDLYQSFKERGFWLYSAWVEVLLGYRSTLLGPLWSVIGTAFFVFGIGALFKTMMGAQGALYIAHLAVGYILWQYIQKTMVQSTKFFQISSSSILDGIATYTDVMLKESLKNLITLLHNCLIVLLAFLYIGIAPSFLSFILLLTVPLVLAVVFFISMVLGILGARYPDLVEMLSSVMRLMFFVTPILWVPGEGARSALFNAVLYFNPFYYLIEVIRGPLVYGQMPYFEIAVVGAALFLCWLAASLLYARTKSVIALWL